MSVLSFSTQPSSRLKLFQSSSISRLLLRRIHETTSEKTPGKISPQEKKEEPSSSQPVTKEKSLPLPLLTAKQKKTAQERLSHTFRRLLEHIGL